MVILFTELLPTPMIFFCNTLVITQLEMCGKMHNDNAFS